MSGFAGSLLLAACRVGDEAVLRTAPELLSLVRDSAGSTALHHAARADDTTALNLLQELINQGEAKNSTDTTPLNGPESSGTKDEVATNPIAAPDGNELWLQRSNSGATPLHDACVLGNEEVVLWLLETGKYTLSDKDTEGLTPLHITARFGHTRLLQRLMSEGLVGEGEWQQRSLAGATLLHMAASAGHLDTVKLLVEKRPATPRPKDEEFLQSDVLWMIFVDRKHDEHSLEKFDRYCPCCNLDSLTNAQMRSGATAAHLAAQSGHAEVVQYLSQEAGASLSILPHDGMTCLHAAVHAGHLRLAQWLVSSGNASINNKEFEGLTSLHVAAAMGHVEIVTWLLKTGAKVTQDFLGGTPLHSAAQTGHSKVCLVLLEAGLDPEARDDEGFIPADLADRCFQYECATLIRNWTVDRKTRRAPTVGEGTESYRGHMEPSVGEKMVYIPPPPAFAPPPVPSLPRLVRQQGLDATTNEEIHSDSLEPRFALSGNGIASPQSNGSSTPSLTHKHNAKTRLKTPQPFEEGINSPPIWRRKKRDTNSSRERSPSSIGVGNDKGSDKNELIEELRAKPEMRSFLIRTKVNQSGSTLVFTAKPSGSKDPVPGSSLSTNSSPKRVKSVEQRMLSGQATLSNLFISPSNIDRNLGCKTTSVVGHNLRKDNDMREKETLNVRSNSPLRRVNGRRDRGRKGQSVLFTAKKQPLAQ